MLDYLYQGNIQELSRYYSSEMEWVVAMTKEKLISPRMVNLFSQKLGERNIRLEHQEYFMIYESAKTVIVSCRYLMIMDKNGEFKTGAVSNATMVFQIQGNQMKIVHVHISNVPNNKERKRYQITDVKERVYFLREEEILYLEAMHNHVIWHCRTQSLKTVDSLKHLEQSLSDSFLRVHRGYIVNKEHVVKIGRCYVEMVNGTILQVPEKKYTQVKQMLNFAGK